VSDALGRARQFHSVLRRNFSTGKAFLKRRDSSSAHREEGAVNGRVGIEFGMEDGGEEVSLADGHGDVVDGSQGLDGGSAAANRRGADE